MVPDLITVPVLDSSQPTSHAPVEYPVVTIFTDVVEFSQIVWLAVVMFAVGFGITVGFTSTNDEGQ